MIETGLCNLFLTELLHELCESITHEQEQVRLAVVELLVKVDRLHDVKVCHSLVCVCV